MISSEVARNLKPLVEFIPICPEVEIGLGIPRDPIRIVSRGDKRILYQPTTGYDATSKMNSFTGRFLDSIGTVHGFLLKDRSPSCGIYNVKIYPGIDKKSASAKGSGFFGGAVMERFPYLPVESEGRLTNFSLREHFYTGIFTIARFDETAGKGSMKDLVEFQTDCKLLLMAYSQNGMRKLGRITANPDHKPVEELKSEYRKHLLRALKGPPRFTSNINVLMHALGYFSKKLTKGEKAFFLETLERYREGKIPLSACLGVVNSWVIRFDEKYLKRQIYFNPYPEELVEISDSGKGRKV